MRCVSPRLAAALLLAAVAAALSVTQLPAEESSPLVANPAGPHLFHPEVRRLPPIEEEAVATAQPAPAAPKAATAEELPAPPAEKLPPADGAAQEPAAADKEEKKEDAPEDKTDEDKTDGAPDEPLLDEEEEEKAGDILFDVDLFPTPDQILIKGEEALETVEKIGSNETWLVRPLQLWSASFEFGISGSAGNNETMDMRFATHIRRETERRRFTGDVSYKIVTNKGKKTTDRLFTEKRHEWLFKDIPWTPYVHGTVEYDRVRKFGARVNVDGGFGYQFYKTDIASLLGRVGLGASTEFESPNDEITNEAVFGLDYERNVTARQRLAASAEYYPELEEFDNYRLNMKASWQVNIDQDGSLSLKLSVTDRYDSTPNKGVGPNDLDYAATLLWSF